MAHLIDMSNNRANIAYKGETPWHGLGFVMNGEETLDEWRIRAGLDWTAHKIGVTYTAQDAEGNQTQRDAEGQSLLYRSDNGDFLSTVSDKYKVVQPADVVEFYRDLCDSHGYAMETAGSLRQGRVVWALAKTGESTRVSGNDVVNGYLLLATSYDGSAATTARFTSVRVVCNNTLSLATDGKKAAVSITHASMFNADAAKVKLGVHNFGFFAEEAQAMAEKGVTTNQAVEFFMEVYHDMTAAEVAIKRTEGEKLALLDKTMARLGAIFTGGPGADLKSAKGTVWGLLNAVTYDIDHIAGRTQDRRLTSAWFGDGAKIKEQARALAVKMAA